MLVSMKKMLKTAREGHYAVPGFTVIDLAMARGCVKAAEACHAPAIISFAYDFENVVSLREVSGMLLKLAMMSTVPVAVHLDHARDIDYVETAIESGFTSAMIDASAKPYEENVRITKEVVKICSAKNASVEAELGHVGGLDWQYGAGNEEIAYTDVEQAKDFVAQTGIDALAVAIGTVHGEYKSEPCLNIERLKELYSALETPLVLHGGSGLSDEDFASVTSNGISKINIHTDLCKAATKAIRATDDTIPYLLLCDISEQAVKEAAMEKYRLFNCVKVL